MLLEWDTPEWMHHQKQSLEIVVSYSVQQWILQIRRVCIKCQGPEWWGQLEIRKQFGGEYKDRLGGDSNFKFNYEKTEEIWVFNYFKGHNK